jgi:hypothetical protein
VQSITKHATTLGDLTLVDDVRAEAAKGGEKEETLIELTTQLAKFEAWLKLQEISKQILDINTKLQADMDEAEARKVEQVSKPQT